MYVLIATMVRSLYYDYINAINHVDIYLDSRQYYKLILHVVGLLSITTAISFISTVFLTAFFYGLYNMICIGIKKIHTREDFVHEDGDWYIVGRKSDTGRDTEGDMEGDTERGGGIQCKSLTQNGTRCRNFVYAHDRCHTHRKSKYD